MGQVLASSKCALPAKDNDVDSSCVPMGHCTNETVKPPLPVARPRSLPRRPSNVRSHLTSAAPSTADVKRVSGEHGLEQHPRGTLPSAEPGGGRQAPHDGGFWYQGQRRQTELRFCQVLKRQNRPDLLCRRYRPLTAASGFGRLQRRHAVVKGLMIRLLEPPTCQHQVSELDIRRCSSMSVWMIALVCMKTSS